MTDYNEINTKISGEEFKNFCEENIIPDVKKLNCSRLKSYGVLIFFTGLYILFLYKCFPGIELSNNTVFFWVTAGVFFVILLQAAIINAKNYKSQVKEAVFNKLLSFAGNFEVENSPNFADLISVGMFKNSNRICCDDAIKGEYKSLPIQIYEITVDKAAIYFESITSSQMFNGILIKMPYNVNSTAPVYILPGKTETDNEVYKTVPVDNEEFSSYFTVFSPEPENAKQNLDDRVINVLIYLAKNGHSGDLSVSIEHGEINIAILSNKDRFEVSFLKSASNIDNYRAVIKDITEVLAVADLFIKTTDEQ